MINKLFKLFFITAFSIPSLAIVNAQAPAIVAPDGNTLYKHGTNAGGINAQENTDSVTSGGTSVYYVLPDPIVNPLFNYSVSLWNNIVSTNFAWTVPGSLSALGAQPVATHALALHYKQISWTGTGTGNIQVVETSSSGCVGSTLLTPVEVISKPSVTSITIPNINCNIGTVPYTTLHCPNATLAITCAVKGLKGVSVVYSMSGPAGFVPVTNVSQVLGNSSTLDLSAIILSQPGIYTLTINSIADRISIKSGLTAIASGITQTFAVTPQPVTGPAYHITNQ